MPANECIPFYEPGGRLTAQATAAVTGKRFVGISGNRVSGPALNTATDGGNYRVAHATAGSKALGVAAHDAGSGDKVPVIAVPGSVVPVRAGADLTAGVEVEVGTNGQAIPLASGIAVGLCMTGATSGNDAEIRLY